MKKIFIIYLFSLLLFNMGHPVTPDMYVDKEVSHYANGILYAVMSLATFISYPFWGNKIDRQGVKGVIIIGLVGYGSSQLLFAYSPEVLGMFIARFGAGLFAAATLVGLTMAINILSPKEYKVKNFGYLMVYASLGAILGQLIAGYIGSFGYTYLPFLLQFIGAILLAIFILIFVDNHYVEHPEKKKRNILHSYEIVKKKNLQYFSLLIILLSMSLAFYQVNIGYYAAVEKGFDSLQIALINSYSGILIIISNILIVGIMEKRFGIIKSLRLEYIVALVAFSLVIIFNDIMFLVIIFVGIFLVATTNYRPLAQSYVTKIETKNQGEMIAIISSLHAVGMILAGFLSGPLFYFNSALPFVFVVICLIIGNIIFKLGVKNEI